MSTEHRAQSTEHRAQSTEPIRVIISHDVDHLFFTSGIKRLRNFIHPKLWIRITYQLITRKISLRTWLVKFAYHFRRQQHRIDDLIAFDQAHGVKATYFFGMNQGLGLVYHPQDAKPFIDKVTRNGFDAGLHGITFDDFKGMKDEYDQFIRTTGFTPCGIRMHYVRYDSETFPRLDKIGYTFDSTEFHKPERHTLKGPYRVGSMWEFPLNIMECYLVPKEARLDEAKAETLKEATLNIIGELRARNIRYITILFHDPGFCEYYAGVRDWYKWLIEYFEGSPDYCFMSFREAVDELNRKKAGNGWDN